MASFDDLPTELQNKVAKHMNTAALNAVPLVRARTKPGRNVLREVVRRAHESDKEATRRRHMRWRHLNQHAMTTLHPAVLQPRPGRDPRHRPFDHQVFEEALEQHVTDHPSVGFHLYRRLVAETEALHPGAKVQFVEVAFASVPGIKHRWSVPVHELRRELDEYYRNRGNPVKNVDMHAWVYFVNGQGARRGQLFTVTYEVMSYEERYSRKPIPHTFKFAYVEPAEADGMDHRHFSSLLLPTGITTPMLR